MSRVVITSKNIDDALPKPDLLAELRKEMNDWQNCITANYNRLNALTEIGALDGGILNPECCDVVGKDVLREVCQHFVELALQGIPVKAGFGNWNVGFMGSRWMDLDADQFGLSDIRCAFYSKKHYKGVWKSNKPYRITITVEKAKSS